MALPRARILECALCLNFFSRATAFRDSHLLVMDITRSCKEAFEITMKRYQQNRLLMLDRTTRWRYCLNYVVDYTCDIFYVCGIELSVTLHPKHNFEQVREVNKRITRLAIGLTNKYRWSAEDLDLGICDRLKALKEIIFVADEERLLAGMNRLPIAVVHI